VVDRATAGDVAVVHGLDAVAVEVEQEGAVVVLFVLRPQAWRAFVAVAGGGARAPELVDLHSRGRGKADVEPERHRLVVARLRDREIGPLDVARVVGSGEPK
jgi:hypothetical protein